MEHDDDPHDEMLITRLDSPPGTVGNMGSGHRVAFLE